MSLRVLDLECSFSTRSLPGVLVSFPWSLGYSVCCSSGSKFKCCAAFCISFRVGSFMASPLEIFLPSVRDLDESMLDNQTTIFFMKGVSVGGL